MTVKRDNSLRKMSSWKVKQDKKGTKKTQLVFEPKSVPTKKATPSESKKKDERKKKRRKRKPSLLRSSPPRPRGGRGSSSDDASELASSADLRSPARRAPRVPGLDVSPPPPVDTPNTMMRRRRESGRGRQLRCRNRGCANPERTFSSDRARERHEQGRCSMRIQVTSEKKSAVLIFQPFFFCFREESIWFQLMRH